MVRHGQLLLRPIPEPTKVLAAAEVAAFTLATGGGNHTPTGRIKPATVEGAGGTAQPPPRRGVERTRHPRRACASTIVSDSRGTPHADSRTGLVRSGISRRSIRVIAEVPCPSSKPSEKEGKREERHEDEHADHDRSLISPLQRLGGELVAPRRRSRARGELINMGR